MPPSPRRLRLVLDIASCCFAPPLGDSGCATRRDVSPCLRNRLATTSLKSAAAPPKRCRRSRLQRTFRKKGRGLGGKIRYLRRSRSLLRWLLGGSSPLSAVGRAPLVVVPVRQGGGPQRGTGSRRRRGGLHRRLHRTPPNARSGAGSARCTTSRSRGFAERDLALRRGFDRLGTAQDRPRRGSTAAQLQRIPFLLTSGQQGDLGSCRPSRTRHCCDPRTSQISSPWTARPCRRGARRGRSADRRKRTYGVRICPVCGSSFTASHHNQVFCPPTDADKARVNGRNTGVGIAGTIGSRAPLRSRVLCRGTRSSGTSRPRPLLPGSKERGQGRALTRRLKKRRFAPKKRRFAPVGQSASVERVICMWASPRVSGVAVRVRGPVRRNEKPCHSRVSRARLVADAVRRLALRAIRVLSGARLQRPRRAASPPSSGMGGVSQWATASWPTRPSPVRCQRPVRRRADGGWCHRHS